jgi:dihydropyrimidine dehydrogenase (NAD+) subunit PreT
MSTAHELDLPLASELRPPLSHSQAVLEADRCLECGDAYAVAPCTVACPADVDVPGFVAALARDDPAEAAETIFAQNLLGGTCARVCPVEVLCQGACVLVHEGRSPIEVASLQRYATDWALAQELPLRQKEAETGHGIAVVGAGPAGLACAGELAARGHDVTVFETRAEIGGLVRSAIAPYRIERAPLPAEMRALERLGVHFRLDRTVSCIEELAGFDAIFLGIGLGSDAHSEIPGDDLSGVWESLPFIEALKCGVPPAVGHHVVVIGGGNTAIDVARESRRLGAEHVTIVYRRTREDMPAYPFEVEEAEREGVRFGWRQLPTRILGDRRVSAVLCASVRLGQPDATGHRRLQPIPGTETSLRADTVVKAIGQQARPELPSRWGGLDVDRSGRLVVDEKGRTSSPHVYAGGDAVNGGSSVVQAVAEGKRAAVGIDRGFE